ncbi:MULTISPECIES: NUDIX hydrolase [unclassified Paenibacillus]|uniref:NUDIX hydrolase n=1 Tax=unclassified Paenibacillus TaxID=185978 RepID=UPI000467003E|nr:MULTISPECIES: NUDIX hydrolase [unclassified Paenibacillus]KGP80211.1 phosphohydrolase [Paenibacillus sp. MAEPY2]KGP86344.1 phosphohydrolase [Paenibacillus sp. MAEPY1]
MFYVNSRAIIERSGNEATEIIIQRRTKSDSAFQFELPGGRIELFESLVQALVREVKEETGLTIYEIEGMETRIDTTGINPEFEVECIRPFAAYQTTKGPIDSVGYYFRCKASGELLEAGDETVDIQWIDIKELNKLFIENPLDFSDVDRAGIKYYLNHQGF